MSPPLTTYEYLRAKYPHACQIAPTYMPLITNDMTEDDIVEAREAGLKAIEEEYLRRQRQAALEAEEG